MTPTCSRTNSRSSARTCSGRLLARLADRIARDEDAVTIKREIVESALRPADEPVGLAELQALFETFSYSAFRLEDAPALRRDRPG